MKQIYKDYLTFLFFLIILNFSGPLAIFLPVPFFIYHKRIPFNYLLFFSLFPVFIFSVFLNDKLSLFVSLLHYGSLVIPSLILVYLYHKTGLESFFRIFIPAVSIFLFVFFLTALFNGYFQHGVFAEVLNKFTDLNNLSSSDAEYLKKVFKYGGPAMVFFSEAVFFLFNAVYFSAKIGLLRDFSRYKTPWQIVVFTVFFIFIVNFIWYFGFLKGEVALVVISVFSLLFFIYFVQGLAIYLFLMNTLNITGFAKVLFVVLIFIYPMPAILTLVGITDFWLDFRKRIIKLSGGKLV